MASGKRDVSTAEWRMSSHSLDTGEDRAAFLTDMKS